MLSNHMYACKLCMHMCQKDTLYGGGTLGPRRAAAPQAGLCVAVRSARAQLRGRPAIHCRATDPATGGPLESPAQTNKCLHRLNVRCEARQRDLFGVSTSLPESTAALLVLSEVERGHSYTHTLDEYTAGTHPFSELAAASAATPCSSSMLPPVAAMVPAPVTVYATQRPTDR
jgi:hypothetical protein